MSSGSQTRKRQHMFTCRWTEEEIARLNAIAEFSGVTKAEVVRRLVRADHANIIPTQSMVSQLRRVGNNINQNSRTLHVLQQMLKLSPRQTDALGITSELNVELARSLAELRRIIVAMQVGR